MTPLLRSFRQTYPEIQLELLLTDTLVDLVAERVDLALRLGPRPAGDWIAARLVAVTMHLVAAPSYLQDAPTLATPDDVARHACLISSVRKGARWSFQQPGAERTVEVDGVIAASNTLVVRRCARDGLGLAVLADWLVDEDIATGRLYRLLPAWTVASNTFEGGVWLVYPSRSFLPQKTRVFINHLRKHVRSSATPPAAGQT